MANSRKEKLEVLLNALVKIDDALDRLIVQAEDRTPHGEFKRLKGQSHAIKMALTETVNAVDGLPLDMKHLTPLIRLGRHLAKKVGPKGGDGEAVARSYRRLIRKHWTIWRSVLGPLSL